ALVPGRERNIVLGFWGSTMPAGMALIIALAPLALALVGWRGLWWIAGALSLVMLAALAYATRDTAAPEEGVAEPPAPLARNVRLTVARLAPWLIFGAFALFTFQWTSVMVWLPTYLIEDKGYGLGTAALLTALVVAVNVPGNLTAGFLIHRGVSRWLMVAIAGAAMGLSVLVVFADGVGDGMRFAACLAFSYFGGLLPTATRAAVPLFAPSHAQLGTTNGLLGQGANLGQLIGPPAVAAIVAATGAWGQARWLMAAAAVGIVALALWSRAAERRALAEGR
ncbi:MAG: MFS transporter, partial [Alphaproteobacteria bacterium]|nr:MFS transporter [Alphaproteobacteria bacterium]